MGTMTYYMDAMILAPYAGHIKLGSSDHNKENKASESWDSLFDKTYL